MLWCFALGEQLQNFATGSFAFLCAWMVLSSLHCRTICILSNSPEASRKKLNVIRDTLFKKEKNYWILNFRNFSLKFDSQTSFHARNNEPQMSEKFVFAGCLISRLCQPELFGMCLNYGEVLLKCKLQ